MNTHLVVIAAGSSTRWGNYLGVPKHLVEIDGESLLERTVRLFGIKDTVIVGADSRYAVKGATLVIPLSSPDLSVNERILETANFWNPDGRTLIVLGDVYFSEEAVETILLETSPDIRIYGREKGSRKSGCGWGEMFCHSFYPDDVYRYTDAYHKAKKEWDGKDPKKCEWWQHYRALEGFPLDEHKIGKHFVEINDMTDDFDLPSDYDTFMKNYETMVHENHR